METYDEVALTPRILPHQNGSEWSDSLPCRYTPAERAAVPMEQEAGWAPEPVLPP
jgi:hypothetical protein